MGRRIIAVNAGPRKGWNTDMGYIQISKDQYQIFEESSAEEFDK